MKIYVGTSLKEADKAKEIMAYFRSLGHEISYDWTTHGRVQSIDLLTEYCEKEINGVRQCNMFFMYHPARMGTHVELGIALALFKPIIMVFDRNNDNFDHTNFEEKPFYYAKNVHRFEDLQQALSFSKTILGKGTN